ncbi:CBS domain-containing protein [archaeon]|nr:CBS domain-containing protein [archaeon]
MMPIIVAKDLMTKNVETIHADDTIITAAHKLAANRLHYLVVLEKDKSSVVGIFGYRQLAELQRRNSETTKINKYILKLPKINKETPFLDIADYMYRLNCKVLLVVENNKLEGIVSQSDIIKAALNSEELQKKNILDLMSPGIITINHNETLGKAFKIMIEKDISRLPIFDNDDMIGIINSYDTINAFYSKSQHGVTREYSPQKIGIKPKSTVKSTMYTPTNLGDEKTAISAFANDVFLIRKPKDSLSKSFDAAAKINTDCIIVKENDNFVGIVTYRDLIPYIAGFKIKKQLYVRISGLDNENIGDFEAQELNRMIEETIKKLSKILTINSFDLHVKTYHQKGKGKHKEVGTGLIKYSMRLKTLTNIGLFVARESDWDIIDSTSKILSCIERLIINEKKHLRDITRNRWRVAKYVLKENTYNLTDEGGE